MSDIVKRLRDEAVLKTPPGYPHTKHIAWEAADEIERLRDHLATEFESARWMSSRIAELRARGFVRINDPRKATKGCQQ